jgi:TonB family protein
LSIQASDYIVHISPARLDQPNWLSSQITVDYQGKYLLGNRLEKVADDNPIVISGPINPQDDENEHKAVFVGVIMPFVPEAIVEQAPTRTFETQVFARPRYLVALGESPLNTIEQDELEGMVIYLIHIDEKGQVLKADLVLSLRSDYDASALDAVQSAQFVPAAQGNDPVDSWMFIPVQFVSSRKMPVVSAPSGTE